MGSGGWQKWGSHLIKRRTAFGTNFARYRLRSHPVERQQGMSNLLRRKPYFGPRTSTLEHLIIRATGTTVWPRRINRDLELPRLVDHYVVLGETLIILGGEKSSVGLVYWNPFDLFEALQDTSIGTIGINVRFTMSESQWFCGALERDVEVNIPTRHHSDTPSVYSSSTSASISAFLLALL